MQRNNEVVDLVDDSAPIPGEDKATIYAITKPINSLNPDYEVQPQPVIQQFRKKKKRVRRHKKYPKYVPPYEQPNDKTNSIMDQMEINKKISDIFAGMKPIACPKGIPRSFLTAEHFQSITAGTKSEATQSSNLPMNLEQTHEQFLSQQTQQIPNLQIGQYVYNQMTQAVDEMAQSNQPNDQTDQSGHKDKQVYSPSDVYNESEDEENVDGEPIDAEPGSKRLSAFKRLGPVTEQKKPKMTINWICNKDLRQVVETVEDEDVPTHLREYITSSTDEVVIKYLSKWPWLRPPSVSRIVSARQSKSVQLFELEQMDEIYKKDSSFFQISVTGYPEKWKKENVLDALLETVKGNSFIPCFVEFTRSECKFLVIRCRSALLTLHKCGFTIKLDECELSVSVAVIVLTLNNLDYVPRLVLRKRLQNALVNSEELDLKEFTLGKDVSHFIYFPLHRHTNQLELLKLQSTVPWDMITKLDLSFNKLKNIHGLFLKSSTPKLKHLNLSHNLLSNIKCIYDLRNMSLKSICLEGNPLCYDYIDQDHYVKVLKMLFPELVEIDGVKLYHPNNIPPIKQNYCPESAKHIVETVLQIFFPLVETEYAERLAIQNMYEAKAVMTITHSPKMRYHPMYLDFRPLFKYARILEEGETLSIDGATDIATVICKWPLMVHDPHTFTVDVLYHTDSTTILRIDGIFKIKCESLAEEEHLVHFTRTLVLKTRDGVEYKIRNEMVYWSLPTRESAKAAFSSTSIQKPKPSLKLQSPPDKEMKGNLIQIFMNLTQLERKPSEKCLEAKSWHLRNALEYFITLLKLDNLDPIMK